MRLFIALDVPDAWRDAAAAQQDTLASTLPEGARRSLRPVRAELMHLTLRFLGEIDEQDLEPLQEALEDVPPFTAGLTLQRAGTFGPAPRTGVVWLGVGGDLAALGGIAIGVESAVRRAGLPGDDRPFAAHLTLARLDRRASAGDRSAVAAAVRALPAPLPLPFLAGEIVLVRSYLEGPSPRYVVLSHHPS
ncbi:MAG: RNA 2',3'-cyclic phosphodiesterase [Dehalococcoidia bacterium]